MTPPTHPHAGLTPELRHVTADRGDAGKRLDLVLRRALAGVEGTTRTRIQSWIASGEVRINGDIVRRPATRIVLGDVVSVALPTLLTHQFDTPATATFSLEILDEDDYLVAVNKPPGIVAHPTHAHPAGTLLDALTAYARGWPQGTRPSLVSRLDKLTSGLILVAKTPAAHAALQRALSAREARKEYLALVYGRVPARGAIELALRRDTIDRRRVVVSGDGVASRTEYERVDLVRVAGVTLSLVRCRLITGRTHQIRVHLASNGWPIVGDPVYGGAAARLGGDTEVSQALRAFPRQALHAARVSFAHPATGARLSIEAPLPGDFAALLALTQQRVRRL